MSRPSVLGAFLAALCAAAIAAACSSGGGGVPGASTLEQATSRGPYGVGVTTIELIDTSRPTEANGDFPGADSRTLITEVWYPARPAAEQPEERDAPVAGDNAPYPLVIFAHGFSSLPRLSASYTQHLASHGYVVAAPAFPESNLLSPGGPRLGAVSDQPADVSFIIDSLTAAAQEQGDLLEGAVDGERVGITGHSLGGLTALLTIYGPTRDERVKAALPIAAPGCFLSEETVGDIEVPLLALGGSQDLLVRPSTVRQPYDVANPPRYLVNLIGANHIQFADIDAEDTVAAGYLSSRPREIAEDMGGDDGIDYNLQGCEADPLAGEPLLSGERERELLRAFATPFFDAYLRGSDDAKAFLQDELPDLVPEARVEFDAE